MPFVNLLTFWQFQNSAYFELDTWIKKKNKYPKQQNKKIRSAIHFAYLIENIPKEKEEPKKNSNSMMTFCELYHRALQTERWNKKTCFTFSKWLIYKTIWFHSFSGWWRFLLKCSDFFFRVLIFFRFGKLCLLLWCIVCIFSSCHIMFLLLLRFPILLSPPPRLFLLSQTEKQLAVF